jgi:hypothetical protein
MPSWKQQISKGKTKISPIELIFLSLPLLCIGLILVIANLGRPTPVNQPSPTRTPVSIVRVTAGSRAVSDSSTPVSTITPAASPTKPLLTPTAIAANNPVAATLAPTPARTINPGGPGGPGIRITKIESGLKFDILVSPGHIGDNTYSITLSENGNLAVTDASAVRLAVTSMDMDMGIARLDLKPAGPDQPGLYSGLDDKLQMLSMFGKYRVEVLVQRPGKDDVTTFFEVSVASA